MCHGKVANRLFACQSLRERYAVRSNYKFLAYADLIKQSQLTKKYGEKYMKFMTKLSRRWLLKFSVVDAGNDRRERFVGEVPASLCAM